MLPDNDPRVEYLGSNPSSDSPIFTIILLSFIGHTLCYLFLPSSKPPLIKSHIISTIHAVVSVASVCIFYLRYSLNLTQINRIGGGGIKGTGDEVMTYNICYSVGYFIHDLSIMLFYKSARTTAGVIHHIIVIAGLLAGIFTKVGHACHFHLLIEELSTIPLNLKTLYHHRPRAHHFFSILFAASFILGRLIYGTIICGFCFRVAPRFIELASRQGDTTTLVFVLIQTVLCLLLRVLNFYWGILIMRKLCGLRQSNKQSTLIDEKNLKEKTS